MYKNFFSDLTDTRLLFNWKKLKWDKRYRLIYTLQEKIYLTALQGNTIKMGRFQEMILTSLTAKLVVIKEVTHEMNYSFDLNTKIKLVLSLKWIDTVNLYSYWEQLNIEISYSIFSEVYYKSIRLLTFLLLEPQWEAYSEPCSFGSRSQSNKKDIVLFFANQIKQKKYDYLILGSYAYQLNATHIHLLKKKIHNTFLVKKCIANSLKSSLNDESGIKFNNDLFNAVLVNILTYGIKYYIANNKLIKALEFPNPSSLTNSFFCVSYRNYFGVFYSSHLTTQWFTHLLEYSFTRLNLRYLPTSYNLNVFPSSFNLLGFSFGLNRTSIKLIPTLNSQKKFIYQIRQVLYKKDFLGRTRGLTHLPLQDAIIRINPIISSWSCTYQMTNKSQCFEMLDEVINNTIYRWQIKKYKKNIRNKWISQCIRYINNQRRIAEGKHVLKLLKLECMKNKKYNLLYSHRSIYDQDKLYWVYRNELQK
uniref:putative reverse transcriptase/maturase n=1 Tax=Chroothece richteriana TaxID=101928 RepID=UPI001FCDDEA1|nr:putative reverse transcriptase/maturase [Chroothece richteriana]UNJ14123.1 putative reverse transcriptase/maturase [Chroothece richteriana]